MIENFESRSVSNSFGDSSDDLERARLQADLSATRHGGGAAREMLAPPAAVGRLIGDGGRGDSRTARPPPFPLAQRRGPSSSGEGSRRAANTARSSSSRAPRRRSGKNRSRRNWPTSRGNWRTHRSNAQTRRRAKSARSRKRWAKRSSNSKRHAATPRLYSNRRLARCLSRQGDRTGALRWTSARVGVRAWEAGQHGPISLAHGVYLRNEMHHFAATGRSTTCRTSITAALAFFFGLIVRV